MQNEIDIHRTEAAKRYGGSLSQYAYHELVKKLGMSKSEAARQAGISREAVQLVARRHGDNGRTRAGQMAIVAALRSPAVRAKMSATRRRKMMEEWERIRPVVEIIGPRAAARELGLTPGQVAGLRHRAAKFAALGAPSSS